MLLSQVNINMHFKSAPKLSKRQKYLRTSHNSQYIIQQLNLLILGIQSCSIVVPRQWERWRSCCTCRSGPKNSTRQSKTARNPSTGIWYAGKRQDLLLLLCVNLQILKLIVSTRIYPRRIQRMRSLENIGFSRWYCEIILMVQERYIATIYKLMLGCNGVK